MFFRRSYTVTEAIFEKEGEEEGMAWVWDE
jgi:hypothetical protein